jgi:hypothetical protein
MRGNLFCEATLAHDSGSQNGICCIEACSARHALFPTQFPGHEVYVKRQNHPASTITGPRTQSGTSGVVRHVACGAPPQPRSIEP